MSETDSFIDEVTEEVRRDKLFALMRRYGWIGILGVLLIVGGAAFSEWRKVSARNQAEAYGDALLAAMQPDDAAARAQALASVDAPSDGAAVKALLSASQALDAGDKAGAIDQLRALIETPDLPDTYRQLAQLKYVMLGGAEIDAAERDTILATLAQAGAPFRALAMEQQALALVAAEKTDEAVVLLRQILVEPDLTAGLRRRATQLIVALGADPQAA